MSRLRFSLRTIICFVTTVGAALGFMVWLGPHLKWVILERNISANVDAIPSAPLNATSNSEEFIQCELGPCTFCIPAKMSKNVTVYGGKAVVFSDRDRSLILSFPKHGNGYVEEEMARFPAQVNWTYPRLLKAICDSKSSDFSFAMSLRQLELHQWKLKQRKKRSLTYLEYDWRSDIEGVLHDEAENIDVFYWAKLDNSAQGSLIFKRNFLDRADGVDDKSWIRRVCASFVVDSVPFKHNVDEMSKSELKSLLRFSECDQ